MGAEPGIDRASSTAESIEVFTPRLTGIGERSHLTSPQVGLSTHILDVVNTIRYDDLDDIVLLGFSCLPGPSSAHRG